MTDTEALTRIRLLARNGEARRIRIESGCTLAEIGRDVGATGPAVGKWETGRSRPTGQRALAYASVIDQLARVLDGSTTAA